MRIFLCSLFISLLGACATPYGDGTFGGLDTVWLAPEVLTVSANGNAFTDDQRVREHALLKASEEALAGGYSFFIVMEEQDTGQVKTHSVTRPEETTFSARAATFGNFANVSGKATTTGGTQTYTMYKPGTRVTFLMLQERPDGLAPGQYYDANFIYNELGPKYIKNFGELQPQD